MAAILEGIGHRIHIPVANIDLIDSPFLAGLRSTMLLFSISNDGMRLSVAMLTVLLKVGIARLFIYLI